MHKQSKGWQALVEKETEVMGIEILHPLTDSDGGPKIYIDIIALHGLNGTPHGTWTHSSSTPSNKKFWLRDYLPRDLPNARVMTYGYNAQAAFLRTAAEIPEHARGLLGALESIRERREEQKRPLLFIGHSMGGLVIKQALVIAQRERRFLDICASTCGILFFGTPHKGSNLASLAEVFIRIPKKIAIKTESSPFLESLSKGADFLERLSEDFKQHHGIRPYEIVSFYETRPLKGCRYLAVEKESALLTPADENPTWENQVPVHKDHRDMCRFGSAREKTYQLAIHSIKQIQQSTNKAEVKNEYYIVPHTASEAYTGRRALLEDLEERLIKERLLQTSVQQRYVLYGLGGSGKTQTSIKFAQENRDSYCGIFWIDATSAETAEKSFLAIARECGLEQNMYSVKTWLSGKDNWLLIMDNADDPDLKIEELFPEGNRGAVLITTRNPDFRVHGTSGSYNVDEMCSKDAVALLLKTAVENNDKDTETQEIAGEIVKVLGHLALAIVQAGTVLRQRICSFKEFCTVYAKQKRDLLESGGAMSDFGYRRSIYTTWEMSLRKIESMPDQHAVLATTLLQICSFYHFGSIRKDLFERAAASSPNSDSRVELGGPMIALMPNGWDVLLFGRAISLLRTFSLISVNKDCVSLHPLVHEWVRWRMLDEQRKKTFVWALSLLAWSEDLQSSISDTKYRRTLPSHMDVCFAFDRRSMFEDGPHPEMRLSQARIFAVTYGYHGRYQEALELWEQIRGVLQKMRSPSDPQLLYTTAEVAHHISLVGRHEEALSMQEDLLKTTEKALGNGHALTVRILSDLALSYRILHKYDEALQLYKRAERASENLVNPSPQQSVVIMTGIALIHKSLGDWRKYIQYILQMIEAYRKLHGRTHSYTVSWIVELADVYRSKRGLRRARQLLTQTLDEIRLSPSDDDLAQVKVMRALATLIDIVGYRRYVPLLEEAANKMASILGETHPETLDIKFDLALLMTRANRMLTAQTITEEVVRETLRTFGQEHWKTQQYSALLKWIRNILRVRQAICFWLPHELRLGMS